MKIASFFRFMPVAKPSSNTRSEVSKRVKDFTDSLQGVKNTAEAKGHKVSKMYEKTEYYANKLTKSTEKRKINDILSNVSKLQKHSKNLFDITGSPLTRSAIDAAKEQRSNVILTVFKDSITHNNTSGAQLLKVINTLKNENFDDQDIKKAFGEVFAKA
ncbi:MAG: hypothetical protein ACRDDD_09320 [Plesiomonas sp.]|uniref:hypothetical protein n=1 Tax=Plesiomonas sp. TaxID=2486279 RepID=UPI003EE49FE6